MIRSWFPQVWPKKSRKWPWMTPNKTFKRLNIVNFKWSNFLTIKYWKIQAWGRKLETIRLLISRLILQMIRNKSFFHNFVQESLVIWSFLLMTRVWFDTRKKDSVSTLLIELRNVSDKFGQVWWAKTGFEYFLLVLHLESTAASQE